MEALAALGIACNIMQVISFTHETVVVCREIFRTGSPDPSLTTILDHSTNVFGDLEKSLRSVPGGLDNDENELLKIAQRSLAAGQELRAEAQKVSRDSSKGNVMASIGGGIKAKLRRKKLEELEKRMLGYQKVLETRLLVRICSKDEAIRLQQAKRFDDLDLALRNLVRTLAQGQTSLEKLLGEQAESIKGHATAENAQSRQAVTDVVCAESSKTQVGITGKLQEMEINSGTGKRREKLLRSLKYEMMNERRNQIPVSHDGTFAWIFRSRCPQCRPEAEGEGARGDEASDVGVIATWDCFSCWLSSENSKLYWVKGKAGAGKSTLTKFLVTHPQTLAILEACGQPTLILSHFIWTAGQPIQGAVKGILLSLLHQILSGEPQLLDSAIQASPHLTSKDFPGDWAAEELQGLLFTACRASRKPLCIFLDGLDEIRTPDTPHALLDLVHRMSALPRVKLCVSSRPEPSFKRRLEKTPQLQLQDLTRRDIEKYARDLLAPELGVSSEDLSHFVRDLCNKAQGVFLWVALAINSLKRGLSNEDTMPELKQRLDALPSDLHRLYQNMWLRANEDDALYRRDAALYFNLMLDHERVQELLRKPYFMGEVCVFHIFAAGNPLSIERIMRDLKPQASEETTRVLRQTATRIVARTAGILELARDEGSTAVSFIHRSAKEFLTNSPEGRQILGYDETTPRERVFCLYRAILARIAGRLSGSPEIDYILCGLRILWTLQEISDEAARSLVSSCRRMYKAGFWISDYCLSGIAMRPLRHFDGLAASFGLIEAIEARFPNVTPRLTTTGRKGIPLSNAYKAYLLDETCTGEYIPYSEVMQGQNRVIAWVVSQGIDHSLRCPKLGRRGGDELVRVARSSIVAVLNLQLKHWFLPDGIHHLMSSTACRCIANFLDDGGPLDGEALVVLFGTGNEDVWRMGFDFSYAHNKWGIGQSMKMAVVLEVNLAFLFDLCLKVMLGLPRPDEVGEAKYESFRDSLEDVVHRYGGKLAGTRAATILAYRSHKIRGGDWLTPATKADSDVFVQSLDSLHMGNDPQPSECVKAITPSDRAKSLGELEAELIRKGHLVRNEDIKDWPPDPYGESQRGPGASSDDEPV